MQKMTLKAGKARRYFVLTAAVWYIEAEKRYDGLILLGEMGKESAKYEASEIRINSRSKETVFRQIADLAKIYPPKTNLSVLYCGEVKT